MPTNAAVEASKILRDGNLFQWYVITLFALVVYVYAVEIERKNWNLFFAGLAFWGMDWFNEIWNGLVFHYTNYAPVWGAPGKTAYLILIGLNIEICFMFAVAGIAFGKLLPADKRLRILGVPNRLFLAITGSAFCGSSLSRRPNSALTLRPSIIARVFGDADFGSTDYESRIR